MRTRIAIGLALAAALAGAAPVTAQLRKMPSPAGAWSFKTEALGAGCVLAGDMTIELVRDKSFKCSFKAVWGCQYRLPRSVETEQSCVATQAGGDIIITSRMVSVGKVDPAEMAPQMRGAYAADNFQLKINTRGDEMDGMFHSYGQAPVKFRKRQELIS
jgi:hypothetical protein